MFRKILLYGLPVYLYALESLLKTIAAVNSESLLGPTLAGAGIGFLLPLTDLKQVPIPESMRNELSKLNANIYYPRDKQLVEGIWVAFFASLAAWMYSVFLTFPPTHPSQLTHPSVLSLPVIIGCVVFAISMILCELKERIT
jgi:hypothetical protein